MTKKTDSQTAILVQKNGYVTRKNLLDHYWGEEVKEFPQEIFYRSGNGMSPDAKTIYLDEGDDEDANSYGFTRYVLTFRIGGGTHIYLDEAWFQESGIIMHTDLMILLPRLLDYIKDFVITEVIATSIDAEDSQKAYDALSDFFSFPRWPAPERREAHGIIDDLDAHMEKARSEGDIQADLDYAQKSPADELAPDDYLDPDPDPEPTPTPLPRTKKKPLTRAEAEAWRKTRGQKTSEDEEDEEFDA